MYGSFDVKSIYFNDTQREAMRLTAGNERQAADAKLEAKSAGGKEWEFLFFYRCRTSLF